MPPEPSLPAGCLWSLQIVDDPYSEGTTGRCLPNPVAVTGGMTVGLCVQACKTAGYSMAGIEYASECCRYSRGSRLVFCANRMIGCGNAISNGALVAPGGISECNMLCNGNSSEYCGAGTCFLVLCNFRSIRGRGVISFPGIPNDS